MRVVRLRGPGGPEQLALEEADRPQPAAGEALIRVHAAAITRDELEWPLDRLPAIPLPALTAWQGLFDHGRLDAGERVLIHGAAGGVGGFAVQFARAAGAHVIGTASAASRESVLELGAHQVLDAATRFEDAADPVDVVLDTVGGERLRRSPAVLRAGGRLVSVAEDPPDGGVFFIVAPNHDQLGAIARRADTGELRLPPVEVYPLTSAREAFARSLEPGRRGKVVLAVAG
jgi:NADPH:quinone reductase-like Zn-dependent oxidoreductase